MGTVWILLLSLSGVSAGAWATEADPRSWLQAQGCRCPVDRGACDCSADRCAAAVAGQSLGLHRALRPWFRELPLDPALGAVVDLDCRMLADPIAHYPCVLSRLNALAAELADENAPDASASRLCEEAGRVGEACRRSVRASYRAQVLEALARLDGMPSLASATRLREACALGGQLKIRQMLESLASDRTIAWNGVAVSAPRAQVIAPPLVGKGGGPELEVVTAPVVQKSVTPKVGRRPVVSARKPASKPKAGPAKPRSRPTAKQVPVPIAAPAVLPARLSPSRSALDALGDLYERRR